MYSWIQKFTYTFQNPQNYDYFNKIRGIIQNACYFLFSTDLNKIILINLYTIVNIWSGSKKLEWVLFWF